MAHGRLLNEAPSIDIPEDEQRRYISAFRASRVICDPSRPPCFVGNQNAISKTCPIDSGAERLLDGEGGGGGIDVEFIQRLQDNSADATRAIDEIYDSLYFGRRNLCNFNRFYPFSLL